MLKELIKMAGEFDRLGLRKEADKIDAMIRKVAIDDMDDYVEYDYNEYASELETQLRIYDPEGLDKIAPETVGHLGNYLQQLENLLRACNPESLKKINDDAWLKRNNLIDIKRKHRISTKEF